MVPPYRRGQFSSLHAIAFPPAATGYVAEQGTPPRYCRTAVVPPSSIIANFGALSSLGSRLAGGLSGRKRRRHRAGVLRRSNKRRRANKRRKVELRNNGGLFAAVDRPLLNLIVQQLSGRDALRLACSSARTSEAVDAVRPLAGVRAEAEDEYEDGVEEARQRRLDAAVADFLATNRVVSGSSYKNVGRRHGFTTNELRDAVQRELYLRDGYDSQGYRLSDSD